jgi:hypothetical protein
MNKRVAHIADRLLILGLGIFFFACTGSAPEPLKIGVKPFQFEPEEVQEMTISKFDPATGDHWTSVLHHSKSGWEISSGPSDQSLLDRRADEGIVSHLIDTFESIRIESDAPQGSLESLGLDPPRFAIRWVTPQKSYEFRIGLADRKTFHRYLTVDGKKVFTVSGSTARILESLESFKSLRKRTWSILTADDVDEIELRSQGKAYFYAQREGDAWTDRLHRPVKADVNSLLSDLTTTHILEFVDNPENASELKKFVLKVPSYEARLTDRMGRQTLLSMKPKNNVLYGLDSSRPHTAFILKPKLLQLFVKQKLG